jgi:hypothetical protein
LLTPLAVASGNRTPGSVGMVPPSPQTPAIMLAVARVRAAFAAPLTVRQLHDHLVTGQDADVVHPHLPADVGEDVVSVLQLHAELRVREGLRHGALHLDGLFLLCHANSGSRIVRAATTAGSPTPCANVSSRAPRRSPHRVGPTPDR